MVLKLGVEEKNTKDKDVKIVLNMIVKNESKIIIRLLESVYKFIDAYCICDTGSDDDTIDIIKDFFTKKNINGYLIKYKFKNFGHNRNWALDKCRILYSDYDFILLLDADMIANFSSDFLANKNNLKSKDYYYVMQGTKKFKYRNIRLINFDKTIQYIGSTHEYLKIPINLKSQQLDESEFFITDIGDGGNKTNKYERDIKILQDDIKEDPDNVRAYFYLANSYFDTGEYTKAINNYKIRIQKGGWFEEIYYSMYRIGLCYMALKKYEKAVMKFLNAYQINPTRAEPLYEIIKHYRYTKNYSLANLFFKQAIFIEKPEKTALFISTDVYEYKLLYEFYIFYYYLPLNDKSFYELDEIHRVFFKLLDNKCHIKNVFDNYKFYANNISCYSKNNDIKRYDLTKVKNEFNSSNSTIFTYQSNVYFIVRYVNYYFDAEWNYKYRDKEATKNYIINYNEDFTEEINEELIQENKREIDNYYVLDGLQDIRTLTLKSTIYYTGNVVFNYTKKEISEKILRGSMIEFGTFDINNKQLNGTIIKSPTNNKCEKNWALFSNRKKIFCIYQWHPMKLGIIKKNKLSIKQEQKSPNFFKYISGSTHGINNNDDILFICHLVHHSKPRNYYHLFVKINCKTFEYVDHSFLFTFENQPIEYCCGMIIKDGILYITYSVKDNTTKVLTIPYNDIKFINNT